MKRILISLLAVCATGTAFAQAQNPNTPPSGSRRDSTPVSSDDHPQTTTFRAGDRHSFDMADTNHDGALTTDEFKQARGSASGSETHFKAFDRNGDGRISPDEWANGTNDDEKPVPQH